MINGILNKETLLPLSLVIAIVVGSVWLNNNLVRRDNKQALFILGVNNRLKSIEDKLDAGVNDRWRGRDMKHWAELLQSMNPSISVPTPNSP